MFKSSQYVFKISQNYQGGIITILVFFQIRQLKHNNS